MTIITATDNAVLTFIQAIRTPALDAFFSAVTHLGDLGALWLAVSAVCLCLPRARRCGVSVFISLFSTAVLVDVILKPAAARVRPFIANGVSLIIAAPSGYSFPSGHTATAFAAASAIFTFNRKAGLAAYITAAIIGFSRLYLYVHYPSDVAGGILIGITAGSLISRQIKKIKGRTAP